jgi:malonyl CoA-acyl carrier protein transacylase
MLCMATALLFPGQGSQGPGMRELVGDARPELLEQAVAAVGEDPFDRINDGTRFAQPALYCTSVALWLGSGAPEADFIAGHSLGELGALVAGGSLTFEDGMRVAARRGRLMQAVADEAPVGGMLALLGAEETAREVAAAHAVTVANDNAPGQLVVSGPRERLDAATAEAQREGLKAIPLRVGGAFHTRAMAPAVPEFEAALREVEVRPPKVPVYSSITAQPFNDVRARLAEALVRPVRWRETLLALHARGVDRFIEVGPGKVLKGLVRRTLPDADAWTLAELEGAHV